MRRAHNRSCRWAGEAGAARYANALVKLGDHYLVGAIRTLPTRSTRLFRRSCCARCG
jgi:hypothetical protein